MPPVQANCRLRETPDLSRNARATGAAMPSPRPFPSNTGFPAGHVWFQPASYRSAATNPDGALTLLPGARQVAHSGLTVRRIMEFAGALRMRAGRKPGLWQALLSALVRAVPGMDTPGTALPGAGN